MTQTEYTSGLHDAIQGCSSWADIQGKLRDLSEKQKGDIFEQLVKAYLLLEPEYASKFKRVWLHREVPQAVLEKLKLPPTDQGIDLVAETNDGDVPLVRVATTNHFRRASTRGLLSRRPAPVLETELCAALERLNLSAPTAHPHPNLGQRPRYHIANIEGAESPTHPPMRIATRNQPSISSTAMNRAVGAHGFV